ncbi:MAG: sulfatase-like hydrolase/transferase [Myxococcota bacterium]|nr:sulfatase-like hydrolase/transferase [Myxococcota bacterium]
MHRFAVALVAALGLALAACGQAKPPNVVLIVVDTLRADHMSVYGYRRATTPSLERLAREAVVFDQAFTVMSHTLPAHVSLLTGVHPTTHQVLSNGWVYDGPWPTLAMRLREAGYHTAAFVSGFPLVGRSGLDRGFEVYEDVVLGGKLHSKVDGELNNRRVLAWLAERDEHPFFAWVHYFDAHTPYTWPGEGDLPFQIDAAFRAHMAELGAADLRLEDVHRMPVTFRGRELGLLEAANLYDSQILRVDGLIEEVRAALERAGRLDDTLFVVTSDHGEGLGQHGYYSHGLHLYEEQLRIPLVVRAPRRAGWQPGRVDTTVSLLDLVPTVLEMAGLPAEDGLHGRRLDPRPSSARRFLVAQRRTFPRGALAGTPELRAVRGGGPLKYLLDGRGREELYDLAEDPGELRNLAEQRPEAVAALRRILDARVAELDPGSAPVEPEVDAETRRRLEELGYAQ